MAYRIERAYESSSKEADRQTNKQTETDRKKDRQTDTDRKR